MNQDIQELSKYVSPEEAKRVLPILQEHHCLLKITKARKTKFGDFRPKDRLRPFHSISVNGNLNPSAFLVTLLHELAHLLVHVSIKRRVLPHGKEWKLTFKELLIESLNRESFPRQIKQLVWQYAQNPKASTSSDYKLHLALNDLNSAPRNTFYVFELATNSCFQLGKRTFMLGELRRTRFLCTELKSGKKFYVHRNAEVIPINAR